MLDPSYALLERITQLAEAIALRHHILDDRIANRHAVVRDRNRECVTDPARLRLIAALCCSDLAQERAGTLSIALHVALQEAREDPAVAAAAGARPRFEMPRRKPPNGDQARVRHHGPRKGQAALMRPL